MFYHGYNVTRILLVKFQLNWSILEILTFEPLFDPLMTFYNIVYVLLWLECHTPGVTRILLVKFELNWNIWKMLTFEPL